MRAFAGMLLALVIWANFPAVQEIIAQEVSEDIDNIIVTTINKLRYKQPLPGNVTDRLVSADPQKILSHIKRYEEDQSPAVRYFAYGLCWRVAIAHTASDIRQEATGRLVKALVDPEPLVWQHAGKHLLSFASEDFTDGTKAAIHQLLIERAPRREVVRIVGVANMQEEMETLGKLLIDESKYEIGAYVGKWYGTVGWAARLARARMGSKADIARAIELVEAEPDDVVRVGALLHDIAYIRQPEAIEVLRRYLDSEQRLPQVKETAPGTPYYQYAMDILTEMIVNFPVMNKCVGCYRDGEIKLAREWMRSQKEFKIKR